MTLASAKLTFAFILACLSVIFLLTIDMESGPSKLQKVHRFANTKHIQDSLLRANVADNQINSFTGNHEIFFHESSGRGFLTYEQACAVESAAFHNHNRSIHVYVSVSEGVSSTPNYLWMTRIQDYKNVEIEYIIDKDYLTDTPLYSWYNSGDWRSSNFRDAHLTNYLRMATLFKKGGLYLSLDSVTLNPLEEKLIWNALVYEDKTNESFLNALIHLEQGHRLIDEILWDMANEYDPNEQDFCGSEALVMAMEYTCGFLRGIAQSNECYDVKALPNTAVHHFSPAFGYLYFKQATDDSVSHIEQTSYVALYSKNIPGRDRPVEILNVAPDTLFAKLAKKHCPVTFSKHFDIPI